MLGLLSIPNDTYWPVWGAEGYYSNRSMSNAAVQKYSHFKFGKECVKGKLYWAIYPVRHYELVRNYKYLDRIFHKVRGGRNFLWDWLWAYCGSRIPGRIKDVASTREEAFEMGYRGKTRIPNGGGLNVKSDVALSKEDLITAKKHNTDFQGYTFIINEADKEWGRMSRGWLEQLEDIQKTLGEIPRTRQGLSAQRRGPFNVIR